MNRAQAADERATRPAITSLAIAYERDVVLARQRARQIARLLRYDAQDQVRIATAVSEIARNAFTYANGGRVEFRIEGTTVPQVFVVRITDQGPGIADVASILEGRYRSETGMGLGIVGARRLMDQFDIQSDPQRGTTVVLKKLVPRRVGLIGAAELARIASELATVESLDPVDEIHRQNQELMRTLTQLTQRQEELVAANRELEDTNRGVVALYAEFDERAEHLRRADEIKTRFLSNMSHEFRTPVNSIQALSRLLLERIDGELTAEQERQVTFIAKAAEALSELVNDLLDLAKVEAGKSAVRATPFEVGSLFGALRGTLRPLLVNESVNLVFEEPEDVPALCTDESKVSQILRNFISNALKFTERGEVRVSASLVPEGGAVAFSVADTGIGIAPEDLDAIFEEFTQIDSVLQRRVKGTGLGLPLCRKLAQLLGGRVLVESTPGVGSTFTAIVPIAYEAQVLAPEPAWDVDPSRVPILVVDDSAEEFFLYEKYLAGTDFQPLPARSVREARDALVRVRPRAIVLDVLLRGEDAWELLVDLKRNDATRNIPVMVVTTLDDEEKARALGADAFWRKPIDRQRLLQRLTQLTAPETIRRILVVDDEEISRYVLRQHLMTPRHVVTEAASGTEALERARLERPDAICLDLAMPDLDGVEVLKRLRADPTTRGIPVLVVTARPLLAGERREVLRKSHGILPKESLSRERALAALEEAFQRAGA